METIFHQIKDFIADGQINITHIDTENQLADLLTKNHPPRRHHFLTNQILTISAADHV
jgi:hypothetical protein